MSSEADRVGAIELSEQDKDRMRLNEDTNPPGDPGKPGPREDEDTDDSQMGQASSHPVYGNDT